MTDAIQAPRPGPDDTNAPDEQKKVHRTETKTRTPVEAKREGPTLEMVKSDERVKVFIRSANQQTGAIGYTEHGERHANTSADGARFILKSLGHDARRCEIAAVAAYLHGISARYAAGGADGHPGGEAPIGAGDVIGSLPDAIRAVHET